MPTWQVLSKKEHLTSGWQAPTHYRHTQDISLIPVVAAELGHLTPYYPLAFVKTQDEQFQLCALLGLKGGNNTFLNTAGRWTAPYVPAMVRSHPFNLMNNGDGGQVLVVDSDSEFFHAHAQAGDQPVLNEEGTPDQSLESLMQFMIQRDSQKKQTDAVVQILAENGVLDTWRIPVELEDGTTGHKELAGIYCVDEQALKALPDDKLGELVRTGALGIAYAQLFSRIRLKDLVKRQQVHDQQTQSAQVQDIDLDKLFGEGDDESIFSF